MGGSGLEPLNSWIFWVFILSVLGAVFTLVVLEESLRTYIPAVVSLGPLLLLDACQVLARWSDAEQEEPWCNREAWRLSLHAVCLPQQEQTWHTVYHFVRPIVIQCRRDTLFRSQSPLITMLPCFERCINILHVM